METLTAIFLVLAGLSSGLVAGMALERLATRRKRLDKVLREVARARDVTAAHVQLVYPGEREPR